MQELKEILSAAVSAVFDRVLFVRCLEKFDIRYRGLWKILGRSKKPLREREKGREGGGESGIQVRSMSFLSQSIFAMAMLSLSAKTSESISSVGATARQGPHPINCLLEEAKGGNRGL